jgi:hypothetical protein
MTITGETNHQRILSYIDLIQRKPNKDVKFFNFDDGKKFIIDGTKLKLLPFEHHHLYTKNEFYVHVNVIDKKVMYYAYDIVDYINGKKANEEEGHMKWDDLETCIYNFFVMNIKELADTVAPYVDVIDKTKSYITPSKSYITPSTTTYPGYTGQNYNSGYYDGPHSYGSPAYKAREAFFDKLWALLKESKTSVAMDLVNEHIGKMCEEKKFEELDILLRMITFDKLNIPTMLGLLSATSAYDKLLKARSEFFDKVKTHITKIKPSRVDDILRSSNKHI